MCEGMMIGADDAKRYLIKTKMVAEKKRKTLFRLSTRNDCTKSVRVCMCKSEKQSGPSTLRKIGKNNKNVI